MEIYNIEKIEGFLAGSLPENEIQKLLDDPQFAKDLAFYTQFKKATDDLLNEETQQPKFSIWIIYRKYIISGIAAMLIMSLSLFFLQKKQENDIILSGELKSVIESLEKRTPQDTLNAINKLNQIIENNSTDKKQAKEMLQKIHSTSCAI